jgi:hypothetical protein
MCAREKEIFVTVWTRVSKKESMWKGDGWIRFAKFLRKAAKKMKNAFTSCVKYRNILYEISPHASINMKKSKKQK